MSERSSSEGAKIERYPSIFVYIQLQGSIGILSRDFHYLIRVISERRVRLSTEYWLIIAPVGETSPPQVLRGRFVEEAAPPPPKTPQPHSQ